MLIALDIFNIGVIHRDMIIRTLISLIFQILIFPFFLIPLRLFQILRIGLS